MFHFDYYGAPKDDSIATMTIAFGDGTTASFTSVPHSHTLSVQRTNTYVAPGAYVVSATMVTTAGRTFTASVKIDVT